MSLTSKLKAEGSSAKLDRRGVATYTAVYEVISDGSYVGPATALLAVGIDIGDEYEIIDPVDGVTVLEHDDAAFAEDLTATLASGPDDGCQWDVTVTYRSFGGEGDLPKNPLEHPLKLSWGSARYDKVADKDRNGVAIVNSAGESFSRPPSIDEYRILLRIVRNEATFSPTLAQTFKGTVNDDVFAIAGENFAAGEVKIADITADLAYHPEIGWYWPVNYEFEVNPNGWAVEALDQGMRYLDPTSGKLRAINDEKGQPVGSEALLDGAGEPLPEGDDPEFLTFDVYPEADFSLLAFDYTDAPGY